MTGRLYISKQCAPLKLHAINKAINVDMQSRD